jgi:hypothetical protein
VFFLQATIILLTGGSKAGTIRDMDPLTVIFTLGGVAGALYAVIRLGKEVKSWIPSKTMDPEKLQKAHGQASGTRTFFEEPSTYRFLDLEWHLAPDFRANSSTALSDIAPHFLKRVITGPICPSCKRDVASLLVPRPFESANVIPIAGNACYCGRPFPPAVLKEREVLVVKGGMEHEEFLHHLRGMVYREAQAAVRKHEL